jgi:hypothetical protein
MRYAPAWPVWLPGADRRPGCPGAGRVGAGGLGTARARAGAGAVVLAHEGIRANTPGEGNGFEGG